MKKLYRSATDRKLCGVCGGLGDYFNIDPTLVRLGWVVLTFMSFGAMLLGYFIAAVIMPDERELS